MPHNQGLKIHWQMFYMYLHAYQKKKLTHSLSGHASISMQYYNGSSVSYSRCGSTRSCHMGIILHGPIKGAKFVLGSRQVIPGDQLATNYNSCRTSGNNSHVTPFYVVSSPSAGDETTFHAETHVHVASSPDFFFFLGGGGRNFLIHK